MEDNPIIFMDNFGPPIPSQYRFPAAPYSGRFTNHSASPGGTHNGSANLALLHTEDFTTSTYLQGVPTTSTPPQINHSTNFDIDPRLLTMSSELSKCNASALLAEDMQGTQLDARTKFQHVLTNEIPSLDGTQALHLAGPDITTEGIAKFIDSSIQQADGGIGSVNLTFSAAWTTALQYRRRIVETPHIIVSSDKTVSAVLKNCEYWVGELYSAIFNVDDIKDTPNSKDRKRFESRKDDDVKVEVVCRLIFITLLDQVFNGYRGSRAQQLGNKYDSESNCFERMTNIVKTVKENKRICKDVLDDETRIIDLVFAPLKVAKNKASRKPLASKVELEDSGDNGTKTNADIARNEAVSTPTFDIQHSPLSRSNIYDGPNKSPSTPSPTKSKAFKDRPKRGRPTKMSASAQTAAEYTDEGAALLPLSPRLDTDRKRVANADANPSYTTKKRKPNDAPDSTLKSKSGSKRKMKDNTAPPPPKPKLSDVNDLFAWAEQCIEIENHTPARRASRKNPVTGKIMDKGKDRKNVAVIEQGTRAEDKKAVVEQDTLDVPHEMRSSLNNPETNTA